MLLVMYNGFHFLADDVFERISRFRVLMFDGECKNIHLIIPMQLGIFRIACLACIAFLYLHILAYLLLVVVVDRSYIIVGCYKIGTCMYSFPVLACYP